MTFALGIVKWLAFATALALAIAFALDFTYRRRQLDRIGHLPQLQRMAASLSPGRRVLRSVLLAVAVTLAVFALARPQVRGETTWTKRGIDVAVVMDYSKSMLARDIYPSRTKRTEIEVDQLLDELEADRVATVAFAGAAVRFPLTHDHEAARILFRGLTPYDMPAGSDLGEGVRMARCMLRPDLLGEAGCGRDGGRGRGGAPVTGRGGASPAPSSCSPTARTRPAARAGRSSGRSTSASRSTSSASGRALES